MLVRARARIITLGSALVIVLTSAACAGVLQPSVANPVAGPAVVVVNPVVAEPVPTVSARGLSELPRLPVAADRWFSETSGTAPPGPSHVEVQGSGYRYRLLVNGQPQVITGMGLNTQYTKLLTPDQRLAQLDADMAALSQLGVNTVIGWDQAEFDQVLLDAAQRHGIGVVLPFDLDPQADYTDAAVRQELHDRVMEWVARYRNHPALRMWGLGNEVLHKIVHPAWVGPQEPQQERTAEAFSDWLIETSDAIHAADPNHPVTYREAEDAFVPWVASALQRQGGAPRPWFVWGTNCYQDYLSQIVDNWPDQGMDVALWVSEFAPGTMAVPDRPQGFKTMWGYVRRHPDFVLGGAVYAWTRNGPEGVDRNFGLTDDGVPVDGLSLESLALLFHEPALQGT